MALVEVDRNKLKELALSRREKRKLELQMLTLWTSYQELEMRENELIRELVIKVDSIDTGIGSEAEE